MKPKKPATAKPREGGQLDEAQMAKWVRGRGVSRLDPVAGTDTWSLGLPQFGDIRWGSFAGGGALRPLSKRLESVSAYFPFVVEWRWTKVPFLLPTTMSGRLSPFTSTAITCVPTPESLSTSWGTKSTVLSLPRTRRNQ